MHHIFKFQELVSLFLGNFRHGNMCFLRNNIRNIFRADFCPFSSLVGNIDGRFLNKKQCLGRKKFFVHIPTGKLHRLFQCVVREKNLVLELNKTDLRLKHLNRVVLRHLFYLHLVQDLADRRV